MCRKHGYFFISLVVVVLILTLGCSQQTGDQLTTAKKMISEDAIKAHIRFLSDDLMEGRAPGSRGGVLASKYIATQLELAGIEPGVEGSYFQYFPMMGVTANPSMELSFWQGTRGERLKFRDDFVGETGTQKPLVSINSELVYVGYGIQAPEYEWDDYKGVDVSGKVLLMLVNDPPSENDDLFGGRALTYYGRWTYKYEQAARMGAAGVILIHTDESAGYGWSVVSNSWSGEQYALKVDTEKSHELSLRAWVTRDAAQRFLSLSGHDFDELRTRAADAGFRPVPLDLDVRTTINSEIRSVETSNVIGIVRGNDPVLSDEMILWTGHYDHLGKVDSEEGIDGIYNGARDNASGVATMLNMALAIKHLQPELKRSVLIIFTAAEESGLIGSSYYAKNPIYHLATAKALYNMDSMNIWGETSDIIPNGFERSDFGESLEELANNTGFILKPDQAPEQGFFFRSDHFPFAKAGVPAVSINSGVDFIGRDSLWIDQNVNDWRRTRYHQPSDEFDETWNLLGALQIARFVLESTLINANSEKTPVWYEGQEFKAARNESLADYMNADN